jgi:cytoskeletal protein RodZ
MTAKFTLKEVTPSETLGEKLYKARRKKGFSLKQIEKEIKVRACYLAALEEGDYDVLPPDVYVQGFLRNYAQFLNLYPKKVLKLYKRERGIKENIKKIKTPKMPKPVYSPSFIITPKTFLIIFLCLSFLTVLGYIWYQFTAFASPPSLEISEPVDNITVRNNTITIQGKTESTAELQINKQPINIDTEGRFKTIISLQDGVNYIEIVAKNKAGKQRGINRTVMAELPKIAGATTPQPPPPAEKQKLEITIKVGPNSAWISIETDGQYGFQGIMLPGTSQTFQANDKITLTTGNAGSTQIILNSKDLGKLGEEGEVKRGIEYTKEERK